MEPASSALFADAAAAEQAAHERLQALPIPLSPFPMLADGGDVPPPPDTEPSTSSQAGADSARRRCFWALLYLERASGGAAAPVLRFLWVDPDAQRVLGATAAQLTGRPVVDFVRKEDRTQAQSDMQKISGERTLFGSVSRCQYATLDTMRRRLRHGAADMAREADARGGEWADAGAPHTYVDTDLVVNWVGRDLALCFFHTVTDTSREPKHAWCGNRAGVFDAAQAQALWAQLYAHASASAQDGELEYVFQVLARRPRREILFSWPPPAETRAETHAAPYSAHDFARLMHGIHRNDSSSATGCTQRFRASHSLTSVGRARHIASVLIPYGSVVLACFQVEGDGNSVAHAAKRARSGDAADVHARTADDGAGGGRADVWKTESHAAVPLPQAVQDSLLRIGGPVPFGAQSDAAAVDGNVATLAAVAAAAAAQAKKCASCGKSNSPEWRRGPSGHKTLCNACGLRYARSLSIKRKKRKDGEVVTLEATGDPSTVPPSRGSGGGSRPGMHRRSSSKRTVPPADLTQPEAKPMPPPGEFADVLANMPADEPSPTFAASGAQLPHSVVMAAAAAAAAASSMHRDTSLPLRVGAGGDLHAQGVHTSDPHPQDAADPPLHAHAPGASSLHPHAPAAAGAPLAPASAPAAAQDAGGSGVPQPYMVSGAEHGRARDRADYDTKALSAMLAGSLGEAGAKAPASGDPPATMPVLTDPLAPLHLTDAVLPEAKAQKSAAPLLASLTPEARTAHGSPSVASPALSLFPGSSAPKAVDTNLFAPLDAARAASSSPGAPMAHANGTGPMQASLAGITPVLSTAPHVPASLRGLEGGGVSVMFSQGTQSGGTNASVS
ncbi:hypothetical protein MSPP1_001347 [Malassezia sp. CBS 17886]|nr:hypothetical protein MSPP1_001347 [Malassezia sp. CBS 17886]